MTLQIVIDDNFQLKDSQCSNVNTNVTYTKNINYTIEGGTYQIPNVCIKNFEDIRENINITLDKLKKLYDDFLGSANICPNGSDCFIAYLELTKICKRSNNDNFQKLLRNFEYEYVTYFPGVHERMEYTSYCYFLQMIIRKLRRTWNKNNNDRLNMKD
ncbi:variable surface protein [Plasmodium gonderi]|uniref:Variable surface protein n=1 Tax=Plasmodium gonderi TaxID=77519 RepID=A0A1Y1JNS2_PLAGO|nr:variable surface protein [Plasmodium gonderi]GAW84119.1 variable surface protein [Plasmodium gonderi]